MMISSESGAHKRAGTVATNKSQRTKRRKPRSSREAIALPACFGVALVTRLSGSQIDFSAPFPEVKKAPVPEELIEELIAFARKLGTVAYMSEGASGTLEAPSIPVAREAP
jgi:hypothetical protein